MRQWSAMESIGSTVLRAFERIQKRAEYLYTVVLGLGWTLQRSPYSKKTTGFARHSAETVVVAMVLPLLTGVVGVEGCETSEFRRERGSVNKVMGGRTSVLKEALRRTPERPPRWEEVEEDDAKESETGSGEVEGIRLFCADSGLKPWICCR